MLLVIRCYKYYDSGCYISVKEGIEGNTLSLTKLTRADGGAYLCIAQNGVPSPVSKRIMVHVHCKLLI